MNNYPEKLKTVQLVKIEKDEFERLKNQKTEIKEETIIPVAVQSQIDALAAMISQLNMQNQTLLQQIEEISKGER
jgi:secreted Zn-dependent insulinase-like peptidase